MLHANLMNTDDIDPKAFHGNIFESVCAQLSSTRKKGKRIWTDSEIRDQLMEALAVDEETLQMEEDSMTERNLWRFRDILPEPVSEQKN